MNTAQEKFKTIFPFLPFEILDKFAQGIEIEMSASDTQFNQDFKLFYDSKNPSDFYIYENQTVYSEIFSPQNPRHILTAYSGQIYGTIIYYWPDLYGGSPPSFTPPTSWVGTAVDNNIAWVDVQTKYDRRIFKAISLTPQIIYHSAVPRRTMSFSPFHSTSQEGSDYQHYFVCHVGYEKIQFNGAESILALSENGFFIESIDYNLLSQFIDILNACKKFSGEIQSAAELSAIENANKLELYRNDLTDKLKAEKNHLENLSLSLTAATQSDLQSSSRDMISIALQAQTLKQSIQNGLRVYNG